MSFKIIYLIDLQCFIQFGFAVFIILDLKKQHVSFPRSTPTSKTRHSYRGAAYIFSKVPFSVSHTSESSYHFPRIICLHFFSNLKQNCRFKMILKFFPNSSMSYLFPERRNFKMHGSLVSR